MEDTKSAGTSAQSNRENSKEKISTREKDPVQTVVQPLVTNDAHMESDSVDSLERSPSRK